MNPADMAATTSQDMGGTRWLLLQCLGADMVTKKNKDGDIVACNWNSKHPNYFWGR